MGMLVNSYKKKKSRFALSRSDLFSSGLHSRQRVREKIERDKAERAKKVGVEKIVIIMEKAH